MSRTKTVFIEEEKRYVFIAWGPHRLEAAGTADGIAAASSI
jgi:hypothetical protein